ncbi:MAG: Tn7 transposase TnsA N-terminal domain-containing protein [Burkholderiales bacterium]|nr:Tn7 transposase TnsA N-terminal domain-containing protein [Burkholderiales bacterium]
MVKGIRIDRPYHLLSEYECSYFYLLERNPRVVDIREQWPILDVNGTIELCAQANLSHKNRGIYPEPYTIDFLITERIGEELLYRAASIKSPQDAKDPEVRKKLAVEYNWCKRRGIPWTLVDTSKFNKQLLDTLRFIRAWFKNRFEPNAGAVSRFAECFLEHYRPNILLAELIAESAKRLALRKNVAEDTFRYCAWSGYIPISMAHQIKLNRPLVLTKEFAHDRI